jgi:DEAD/DEAH box helicase domain-containing protein
VRELDLHARRALVEPFDGDWYTQAKKETETSIEEPLRVERRLGLELSFGRVSVTEQVVAYQKKAAADGSTLDTVPLDLPPTTFDTEAVWFVPRPHQLEGLEAMPLLLSSLHAAEHSLIALLSTDLHLDTGAPTVFVYDGHAGGVGIAARGFDQFEGWVADTAELLAGCPCERGCPSCVQSPKCGNLNEYLDKAGALTLLTRMSNSG